MAVNVSKLWRNGKFQKLDKTSKLLYIYLATSPDINTLGLLNTNQDSIKADLSLPDSEFRAACKVIKDDFIKIFMVEDILYFFLPDHFPTLARSVTVSKKAYKDIAALPEEVVDYLNTHGLMPEIEKHTAFDAPTVEEVEAYAISKGYLVEGKTVVDFYEGKAKFYNKKGWYDSRGKAVKDWRGKLRQVWFKDEIKLKECTDAPKGFEFFFVKEGESYLYPDHWKDGLPVSKSGFLENKILQREYNKKLQK